MQDDICPWPYESSYVDHQPTCVFHPSGLGSIEMPTLPTIGIDRPPDVPISVFNPASRIQTYKVEGPSLWGYSVGPEGITDYRWMVYAGLGLVAVLLLSGLKRRR